MPETSDILINSLNQRIGTLERELAQTRQESRTRKLKIRELTEQNTALTTERDGHAATIATITTERDGLKTKLAAGPDEKDAKIGELELKLRTRSHQDRFNELAKEAGCDESSLAAAWKLSGYTPESDEPDDGAISEAIETAKSELSVAFKPAQSGQGSGPAAPKKAPLSRGVGSERGHSAQNGAGLFTVRKSDMRSSEYMRLNQEKIYEAQKAGTFRLIDG